MRMHRTLATVLMFALLGLTPLALAPSSTAAERTVAPAASSEPVERAKKTRKVVLTGEKKKKGWVMKVQLTPRTKQTKVIIQLKKSNKSAWKKFKVARTHDQGGAVFTPAFPKSSSPTWKYRARVPGNKQFKGAKSNVVLACARIVC